MVSREAVELIRLTIPEIGDEEIQVVTDVLRSGYLVQGKYVRDFEQKVADYLGARHAIAVSSGTAALHLSLIALGIGFGDEVILPDFTFPATANVVEIAGAKPVLVDIDLDSFNVNVDGIRKAISPRTKAILPVHLFGQSADMDPILDLAREHRILVMEDAACALGAEYHTQKCGTLGILGCFSFHPRKAITTGEGGMVVTNVDELAERLRQLRNHGLNTALGLGQFEMAGLNYRMTDFQGALGSKQMGRLEDIIAKRRALAQYYRQSLVGLYGIKLPEELPNNRHIWQSYVILLRPGIDRNRLIKVLKEAGVETTIGTYAISAQPHNHHPEWDLPISRQAYHQSLSLPLHTRMSETDVDEVVRCLKKAVQNV